MVHEKQTSDTRTAAPSITHGSSLHASKIRRVAVAACKRPPVRTARIEFVATSSTRAAFPEAICRPAFSNQRLRRHAPRVRRVGRLLALQGTPPGYQAGVRLSGR